MIYKRKNKKGSMFDVIIFIIMALIVVLFFGAFLYGINKANDVIGSIEFTYGDPTKPYSNFSDVADDTFGQMTTGFQQLKLISFAIIIGMMLTIMITSFFVKMHPVFFIVYVFMTILAVILAVPLSNAYENLLSDATLGPTYSEFTMSNEIILNLPLWVTVIGIIGLILMTIGFSRNDNYGDII